MKRKSRGHGALMMCLLAVTPLPLLAATSAAPGSPEQVADLYLRLFVNQDLQALEQLNAYLAPAYGGEHPFDGAALSQAIAEQQAQEEAQADEAVAAMPKAEQEKAKSALLAAIRVVGSAIVHSRCKAVSSEIHPNEVTRAMGEEYADDDIATVTYRCKVPTLDPQLLGATAGSDAMPEQQELQRQRQAIEQGAGAFVEVEGSQDLYRGSKSGIWLTGATDAWLQPVMDSLP